MHPLPVESVRIGIGVAAKKCQRFSFQNQCCLNVTPEKSAGRHCQHSCFYPLAAPCSLLALCQEGESLSTWPPRLVASKLSGPRSTARNTHYTMSRAEICLKHEFYKGIPALRAWGTFKFLFFIKKKMLFVIRSIELMRSLNNTAVIQLYPVP